MSGRSRTSGHCAARQPNKDGLRVSRSSFLLSKVRDDPASAAAARHDNQTYHICHLYMKIVPESMKRRVVKRSDRKRADAQVKEFERRDLGDDIVRSGAGKMIRRPRTTSIRLDHGLIDQLRAKAAKRGLGYQTMLKMIVMEHLDEYRPREASTCFRQDRSGHGRRELALPLSTTVPQRYRLLDPSNTWKSLVEPNCGKTADAAGWSHAVQVDFATSG